MKRFFLALFILLAFGAQAQQSAKSIVPFASVVSGYSNGDSFKTETLPTFGLYGIGNTNTETFNNINSSGKLSGYIRPFKSNSGLFKKPGYVDVNFAFNVNASNTDSLLSSTFLFPDVGSNSFSGNVSYNLALGKFPDFYLISPFFEFSNKSIKGRKADSTKSFYTINSSLGVNFQYLFMNGPDKVSFGISPYLATVNVPEPGVKNYKYLFTGSDSTKMKTTVKSWGVKVVFQYNYFQVFADFRTVNGSDVDFPFDGLRGFHPNIGIIFNAEIFEK
ncbi:MAG TPA: hypothetical protein VL442_00150 [Mucilaginibacter sp.]|jgi:hypothetical protein|nr:hypothetical protein [Mucilaginibacter sp.]